MKHPCIKFLAFMRVVYAKINDFCQLMYDYSMHLYEGRHNYWYKMSTRMIDRKITFRYRYLSYSSYIQVIFYIICIKLPGRMEVDDIHIHVQCFPLAFR